MLSYEEIMNFCSNYMIQNGVVIDKNTNQQVLDEDTILKVRSSVLLFNEAKSAYQSDVKQFGNVNKNQEYYIKKTMEKFSVNNEENVYGVNKLVNAILNSNGHYEELVQDYELTNTKFSFLVSPKSEYGLAFLKLKFREKGLDIEGLKISHDVSQFNRLGSSRVIIDFKIKKYEKTISNQQSDNIVSGIQHPRAAELNDLEKQKQIAKQNNDEVAYNFAKSAIEKIVRESRFEVSPEKWDSMSIPEQIDFVKIKINESKILKDQDEFNYWNSVLNDLNAKLVSQSEVITYNQPLYNSAPVTEDVNTADFNDSVDADDEGVDVVPTNEEKDYKYYYNELMKAVEAKDKLVNPTEAEKKQIIGEIFYNLGFFVESLNTEQEFNDALNLIVNNLNDSKLQNIIMTDMQERYDSLFKKADSNELEKPKQTEKVSQDHNKKASTEQTEVSVFVDILKEKMNIITKEYKYMNLDDHLDGVETAILIKRVDELIETANAVKPLANNQNEVVLLNSILDRLYTAKKKMKANQVLAQDMKDTLRRM
ncbi:MAG: hypothetical protein IJZ46_04080 [Bacilli bacterium]|nr:hypothetical protein [Bacilli bacterium]